MEGMNFHSLLIQTATKRYAYNYGFEVGKMHIAKVNPQHSMKPLEQRESQANGETTSGTRRSHAHSVKSISGMCVFANAQNAAWGAAPQAQKELVSAWEPRR